MNLHLLGAHEHDLSRLPEYCELAVEGAVGVPIAANYPVFGDDAFRTGTGVHAAAIIKARQKGDAWLADRIYSGVPAGDFGLEQRIEISPVSGSPTCGGGWSDRDTTRAMPRSASTSSTPPSGRIACCATKS